MTKLFSIGLSISILALVGCSKDASVTPKVTLTKLDTLIVPSATTSGIDAAYDNPHYIVYDRTITSINKLMILLPGNSGHPDQYKLFVQKAASLGYHAIGLQYVNPGGIFNGGGKCEVSSDVDAFYKARLEMLTGTNSSVDIDVSVQNGIINRITSIVTFLKTKYPKDGWEQYLSGAQMNWPKIVMAGHSQGAGFSVFMTKFYPIDRAIMMSNKDYNATNAVFAPWYSLPNVSSSNNVYGFTHGNDEFADQKSVWLLLGLDSFGAIVNVDNATTPYSNSRRLTSAAVPAQLNNAAGAHLSIAVDNFTPKDSQGKPVFDKVWEYLLK